MEHEHGGLRNANTKHQSKGGNNFHTGAVSAEKNCGVKSPSSLITQHVSLLFAAFKEDARPTYHYSPGA